MRTVYGRLTTFLFLMVIALLLFLPMRSGLEDHLYAYPHNIRMNKGDSYAITYELDSDHAQKVTYASLDVSVAEVDRKGRITAVNPGTTDIRLDAEGGARTMVHVEVVGIPATSLVLNTDRVSIEKGQVTGLSASFNEDADDTRIEWRSMNPEIAQVDAVGRITGMRGGTTKVYAIAPNGLRAGADVFVHVSGDAVRITPEELTIGTGASLKMGTYYFPDDTTDEPTHWTTSDSSVMTVDDSGTINAVGEGQVVLSVFTREGLSSSSIINVEPSAESFSLSPSAVTIERGNAIGLEPLFINADGERDDSSLNHYTTWTSSNPEIASVEDGRVIGHKTGRVFISATADGMTAICNLRVQVLVHEITLDKDVVYMLREETVNPIQLRASISPADPDDPTIRWSSNNDMVASVDQTGLVTMTGGYGSAIITAQAASGIEAHFSVNVVTEIPDPDAMPTINPFDLRSAPDAGPVDKPGGFSFDDIGNGVEAGQGGAPDTAEPSGAAAAGGDASGSASGGASGGFSFDDIGNSVEAHLSVDEDGSIEVNTQAAASPAVTPKTNYSQEVEAYDLFAY